MNESNELKDYIDNNIDKHFSKIATLKNEESSKILLYQHKSLEKNIIMRISKNRNDDVFRELRGKNIKNAARIYDVCSEDNQLVVLEEHIEGKSLLQIMDYGLIPTKIACKYAYQLCNALKELHSFGIIHRDIKPSNVIINNSGEAYLIDLGIARKISSNDEKDTQELGTVGFAAPEQFGLSQSGKSTDIYALGILLNMMITGVHPAIETPKGLVKNIINKSTSTQISKRYSNATKMQKALKYFI